MQGLNFFELGAGRDNAPLPVPALSPPSGPDEQALAREFERLRQELELAQDHGDLPGSGLIRHPHLGALRTRVLTHWDDLTDACVLESCLGLIAKMQADYGAMVLGYEYLTAVLLRKGADQAAEYVADRELAAIRQEERDAAPARDYIPQPIDTGGVSEPTGAVAVGATDRTGDEPGQARGAGAGQGLRPRRGATSAAGH